MSFSQSYQSISIGVQKINRVFINLLVEVKAPYHQLAAMWKDVLSPRLNAFSAKSFICGGRKSGLFLMNGLLQFYLSKHQLLPLF